MTVMSPFPPPETLSTTVVLAPRVLTTIKLELFAIHALRVTRVLIFPTVRELQRLVLALHALMVTTVLALRLPIVWHAPLVMKVRVLVLILKRRVAHYVPKAATR
jgi:hypothetical protein